MNLELKKTLIPGCYELQPRVLSDARGAFVKTFNRDWFVQLGLCDDWAEQYYSVSGPRVLRGLHFQLPPYDHAKLVYCIVGRVLDVVVDIRKQSPTYGKAVQIDLTAGKGNMVYLAPGLAHGFCTFDESATLVYNLTSQYEPACDAGLRWDSAGISWPEGEYLLSDRDRDLPGLAEFDTPFYYKSALDNGESR